MRSRKLTPNFWASALLRSSSVTTPSSTRIWPRRLRVSFWRPMALSTCSSVTRPMSLRMSPRRSLDAFRVRRMTCSSSTASGSASPAGPSSSSSRAPARVSSSSASPASAAPMTTSSPRSPISSSTSGTSRPWPLPPLPPYRSSSLRNVSTMSPPPDTTTSSAEVTSLGVMIGSSSSPPLPFDPASTTSPSLCLLLRRGISHHFQWRRTASPQLEGGGRLPEQHLQAVRRSPPHVAVRRCEQVGAGGSVDNVENDLPRRNVIGQRRRDFTCLVHTE